MKIIYDNLTLNKFDAWSGAVDTKNRIIEENKEDAFDSYIEEMYPDGIEAGALNDLLWFEEEYLYEVLGITDEEEKEDSEEDESK